MTHHFITTSCNDNAQSPDKQLIDLSNDTNTHGKMNLLENTTGNSLNHEGSKMNGDNVIEKYEADGSALDEGLNDGDEIVTFLINYLSQDSNAVNKSQVGKESNNSDYFLHGNKHNVLDVTDFKEEECSGKPVNDCDVAEGNECAGGYCSVGKGFDRTKSVNKTVLVSPHTVSTGVCPVYLSPTFPGIVSKTFVPSALDQTLHEILFACASCSSSIFPKSPTESETLALPVPSVLTPPPAIATTKDALGKCN